MDPKLQLLIDEAAIKNVHHRYCRGVDRMDWDMVRSCYHPDAIDDHGPFKGSIDEFIAWVIELLPPRFAAWTHFSGQQLVEVDGDKAWMESYSRAYHRTHPAPDGSTSDWILNLRYVDQLERRNGDWRILTRILACESEITIPVAAGDPAVLGQDWHSGTHDMTDWSYTRALAASPSA